MHLFLSCPLCFPLVMYVLNLFVVDVLLSLWLLLSLYWTRALFIFYFCFAYPHSWSCPRSCSSLLSCLPLALVLLVLTLVLIVLFYCLDCDLILSWLYSCLDCPLLFPYCRCPYLACRNFVFLFYHVSRIGSGLIYLNPIDPTIGWYRKLP